MLLDLQLNRACPRASALAGRRMNVVQQTAVSRRFGFLTRRPFLVAPFELQLQVVVLEGAFGTELAEDFARDPDRGPAIDVADDGEHLERVAAGSDRLRIFPVRVALQSRDIRTWRRLLHPCRPTVEIGPVPERSPAGLRAHADDAQQPAGADEASSMHNVGQ